MTALHANQTVAVIGAGTMGAGIAQLAAGAGHPVILYDAWEGAAEKGKQQIAKGLDKLVSRGKMEQDDKLALLRRIYVADDLDKVESAGLVVEAIVEQLEAKRELFKTLEQRVSTSTILATNTSSISVTAIACGLTHPGRVIGMHFFNPAPIMKLVEVISGVATDPQVAETVYATAEAWGKVAVHAKSTPGFIVNRVARPFYAEALRLYEEQVASPASLDALLTGAGGFRLGPFALMDLIGNDINYAVSESVFNAYYQEPRFRPSLVQKELVNAGHLGRKSGQGFYSYDESASPDKAKVEPVNSEAAPATPIDLGADTRIDEVLITCTDGRTAAAREQESGHSVILLDLCDPQSASVVGFCCSPSVSEATVETLVAGLAKQQVQAIRLPDWPALVVMRTVAMLANEAFEAVMQGVASEQAIDNAMKYGVNYPKGPIHWARELGLGKVLGVLDALHTLTLDPRYRASLGLRLRAS